MRLEPDPPTHEEDAITSGSTAAPPTPSGSTSAASPSPSAACARSTTSASPSSPGQVTGFLGPQRRGQDDDAADGPRADHPRPPARDVQRHARTPPCREPIRTGRRGAGDGVPPGPQRPQPPAGVLPRRRAARSAAPTRCSTRSGSARRRQPQGRRLLPRHAPAARPGHARCSATPRVLVLDEPANGLDPEGIQWLRGFLRHLAHDQGRTVLVSSHLLSEVEQTVDRVVIVGAGRLVREGSHGRAARGPTAPARVLVRSPAGAAPGRGAARRRATAVATDGDGRADRHRAARRPRSAAARSPRGIELHELRAHTSGLEEVYFRLTAGQEQFAAADPARRPSRREQPDDPPGPRRVDQAASPPGSGSACSLGAVRPGRRLRRAVHRASPATPTDGPPGGRRPAVRAAGPLAGRPTRRSCSLILGIIGMTQEYRHRTATPTFLTAPHRGQVVVAKLLAYALSAAAFALVVVVVDACVVVESTPARRGRRALADRRQPARCWPFALLALVIYAVIGVGLGALLRNQVGAIVGALVYLFVVEPIIRRIPATAGAYKWLPGGALEAMTATLRRAGPARALAGRGCCCSATAWSRRSWAPLLPSGATSSEMVAAPRGIPAAHPHPRPEETCMSTRMTSRAWPGWSPPATSTRSPRREPTTRGCSRQRSSATGRTAGRRCTSPSPPAGAGRGGAGRRRRRPLRADGGRSHPAARGPAALAATWCRCCSGWAPRSTPPSAAYLGDVAAAHPAPGRRRPPAPGRRSCCPGPPPAARRPRSRLLLERGADPDAGALHAAAAAGAAPVVADAAARPGPTSTGATGTPAGPRCTPPSRPPPRRGPTRPPSSRCCSTPAPTSTPPRTTAPARWTSARVAGARHAPAAPRQADQDADAAEPSCWSPPAPPAERPRRARW